MKRRSSNNILKAVAEVRRGFTTGANEFFYLTEEQVTSSPTLSHGASTRAKTLGWWRRCRGSSVRPRLHAHRTHLLVWGGSPRRPAAPRPGISSQTATPSSWTHRFHPFGRPLSKRLFNVKFENRIFKFTAIHPSLRGSSCEVRDKEEAGGRSVGASEGDDFAWYCG